MNVYNLNEYRTTVFSQQMNIISIIDFRLEIDFSAYSMPLVEANEDL